MFGGKFQRLAKKWRN